MSEPEAIHVRMTSAGTLHLKRDSAPRMLCGVPVEGSKPMSARSWENEETQFKCGRCRDHESQVARPQ